MVHAIPFFLVAIIFTLLSGNNAVNESKVEFSRSHTNMLRGIAILLIMGTHITGVFPDSFGRLLTPWGG